MLLNDGLEGRQSWLEPARVFLAPGDLGDLIYQCDDFPMLPVDHFVADGKAYAPGERIAHRDRNRALRPSKQDP